MGWLPLVAVVLAACERGPSQEEYEAVLAEKDSLMQEVAENARVVSVISAELAKVQVEGERVRGEGVGALAAEIENITARLNATEARLREARARISALTTLSDSLRATLEQTVANYESVIADQRTTVAQLTERVAELEAANEKLAQEKAVLSDSVGALTEEANTVYYVIGTKDELLRRGIIEKEGGARFLFVLWKQGETLVPARDLDPGAFTAIDKRQVTEIPLPDAEMAYRIASRQDPAFLGTPTDAEGLIRGESLRIAAPDEFWRASKFLILVQG